MFEHRESDIGTIHKCI